jgi:hypothetical protein
VIDWTGSGSNAGVMPMSAPQLGDLLVAHVELGGRERPCPTRELAVGLLGCGDVQKDKYFGGCWEVFAAARHFQK